ncbi:glutathione S-transferase C-terminal-like protein [Cubamyces lactineus]|nr:glutathione S-transferase C-terminal-like protein [Cubamyces lactineus]
MVLKLHGNAVSTCSNRVRVVCEELGVPYELIPVEFTKREHKSPGYIAIQPFGQVPYLDDDGFKVFESRAIARYIALKYGGIGTLIPDPRDLQKTALFEQAASTELTNFDFYAGSLALDNIFKPFFAKKMPDPAAIDALKSGLEGRLAGYDVLLGRTKYLAGDDVTLVDLFHLPHGALLEEQGIDFLVSGRWPNVTRWWIDISSRESWKKISSK